MKTNKEKLTTVKVNAESWDGLKRATMEDGISFRLLVQASIEEYIFNESFRDIIKDRIIKSPRIELRDKRFTDPDA